MIAAIENGIIARLRAASDAGVLGYAYRHLGSYPTDWDMYLKEAQINCPAAWVTFGGWSSVDKSRSGTRVRGSFGLVVAAMNHRNEVATRHGQATATGTEVGSYQMVLDACGLLLDHDLGLSITGLELGSCQFVRPSAAIIERKWSMLAVQFTTQFQIAPTATGDDDLNDFRTFDVRWESPDSQALAHDIITLPTAD